MVVGGVSWGFTFGASATDFVGTVSNIRRPSDVNGVYAAAGAGAQNTIRCAFESFVLALDASSALLV
jgi:hypothetical protein